MEYGIAFPSMDLTDPGAIREFAQGAEALGYTLWGYAPVPATARTYRFTSLWCSLAS